MCLCVLICETNPMFSNSIKENKQIYVPMCLNRKPTFVKIKASK